MWGQFSPAAISTVNFQSRQILFTSALRKFPREILSTSLQKVLKGSYVSHSTHCSFRAAYMNIWMWPYFHDLTLKKKSCFSGLKSTTNPRCNSPYRWFTEILNFIKMRLWVKNAPPGNRSNIY